MLMGLRRNVMMTIDPPPFDIRLERVQRRQAVLDRMREVEEADERVKSFQREHYSTNASGQLTPKVSTGVVDVFDIHLQHARLVREWSAAVDRHQAALKSFAEIAE
jgi:hypothetical protein